MRRDFPADVLRGGAITRMSEMERRMLGFRLATAEILYRMPDHPDFLQSFIWQELDIAPRFPVLHGFLDFWHRNLDGRLHSVRVACADLVAPAELRLVDDEFRVH